MIRIDHVTFSYGGENENAGGVHDINLTVEDGQCVVLCGESGSGKTTITRLINGLIPHYYEGKMNGEVWVNGAKVSEQPLYDTAKTVGSVFQNPRSQFFNVDTTSEITFGCENLGQPEQSIRERLDKTIRDFRLEKLMGRNIFHLSGGEKQKIACAGVSIMEPDVLVMDEPSSNLDASSILDLRAILAFWKSQGKTIIVSEHRLYYLRGLADRFIYITGGKVEKDYSAAEFESLTEQQRAKLGLRTFILEDLLPPKALPQAGQQMELRNFCVAHIVTLMLSGEQDFSSYMTACIVALCGYLGKVVFANLSTVISHTATYYTLRDLRENITAKLARVPMGTILDTPSGQYKTTIVDRVEGMEPTFAHLIPEMTANVLVPIVIVVYLFVMDWRMALLSLVTLVVGLAVMSAGMKNYPVKWEGAVKAGKQMTDAIVEYIGGIEVVKAFSQSAGSYKKYSDAVNYNANYYVDWMRENQKTMSAYNAILPSVLICVLPCGFSFWLSGSLELSTFLSIVIFSLGLVGPIIAAFTFTDDLAVLGTNVEEISQLLNAEELNHKETPIKLEDTPFMK